MDKRFITLFPVEKAVDHPKPAPEGQGLSGWWPGTEVKTFRNGSELWKISTLQKDEAYVTPSACTNSQVAG